MPDFDRIYCGRLRAEWRGRRCRIVNTWRRGGPHNVQIEFDDGRRAVCPARCVRKES